MNTKLAVVVSVLILSTMAMAQKVAVKGLDPVLLAEGKEVAGQEGLTVKRGRLVYRFSTEASRARFEAQPERYSVQLNGECVMGPEMDGDPNLFVVVQGRIYIGASEWCLSNFKRDPNRFVEVESGRRRGTISGQNRRTVGILVFPGVQIIDYTGPFEVFGASGFDTFLVAESLEPFKTAMGMSVIPRHTFADCPKLDVLVVPGGGGSRPGMTGVGAQMANPTVTSFVKAKSKEAEVVLSVCNGAFILAQAGLLDGLTATTFAGGIPLLTTDFPKIKVVDDQRFVDNGKFITTAGLSSGIDGALHVVERLRGRGAAQRTALGIEYDWRPDSGYARASLADIVMRPAIGQGFDLPENTTWVVESDLGDRIRWEKLYSVGYEGADAEKILAIVDRKLEQSWKKGAHKGGSESAETSWSFTDIKGQAWAGTTKVTRKAGSNSLFTLSIRVEKRA